MSDTYAVLTGDLIDSTDLPAADLDRAMAALNTAARDISGWRAGIVSGFARRGGDSWQYALSAPPLALRAALYLRAALRRCDKRFATRIAIADGPGTLPPPERDPNRAHGAAFTASGRLLESLSGHAQMTHAAGGPLGAAVRLADHVSQGWTEAQARAVYQMLPPGAGPRADAAARLGITRQAVNQALWSAGFPALGEALDLIEAGPPGAPEQA